VRGFYMRFLVPRRARATASITGLSPHSAPNTPIAALACVAVAKYTATETAESEWTAVWRCPEAVGVWANEQVSWDRMQGNGSLT
jgi:hypothetical protein